METWAASAAFFMYSVICMNTLLNSISQHGYLLVFLVALGEAVGLPVPAALAIIAAGAAAAAHILKAPLVFAAAIGAILVGDVLLFFLGRYTGWALLAALCRLSLNPETCILRSAESFYKRGRTTLVFAKFIPGINTMAPPLAGSMKMKPWQFLQFDLAGACLYVFVYGCLGYLSRDFVARITQRIQSASHVLAEVVLLAIFGFVIYRIAQYRSYKSTDVVPRVAVEELARRIASSENGDVIVADVRSHGYYDSGASRIAGSIRLEPNRLSDELKALPRDKDIYIYCS
jgi:membrane protein DedA with SNARE-associated domain